MIVKDRDIDLTNELLYELNRHDISYKKVQDASGIISDSWGEYYYSIHKKRLKIVQPSYIHYVHWEDLIKEIKSYLKFGRIPIIYKFTERYTLNQTRLLAYNFYTLYWHWGFIESNESYSIYGEKIKIKKKWKQSSI
jgi:hypothetical protein